MKYARNNHVYSVHFSDIDNVGVSVASELEFRQIVFLNFLAGLVYYSTVKINSLNLNDIERDVNGIYTFETIGINYF